MKKVWMKDRGETGAFNALVPEGGTITGAGADVQAIYGAAFGNP